MLLSLPYYFDHPAFHPLIQHPNILMCRYLSVSASLACEADFMFVPEFPPPHEWPDQLCKKLISVMCWDVCGEVCKGVAC